MNKVMLSFCLVTYNHEKYIQECIDSILNQKVNFEIEILIGNDCSGDKTGELIEKLYGNKVNLINRKENVGLCKNLYDLFMRASGKYVFLFSGDDYIVDKYALQKQVDFLENHEEYFSVSAKNYIYDQQKNAIREGKCKSGDFTIYDYMLDGRCPCIYGTMRNVFSKEKESNSFLQEGARNNEEIKMWMYTLDHGKKYILDSYMTVYRSVDRKGEDNYCSNTNYMDRFRDYYKDILLIKKIYRKKYNMMPYKCILLNRYCNDMSTSIRRLFEFLIELEPKDLIEMIWYKIYLKTHNYKIPKRWKDKSYIIKYSK